MASGDIDPREAARLAHGIGDAWMHVVLGAAGVGAAVVRLATYAGPPRSWGAVMADAVASMVVGYGVGALVYAMSGNPWTVPAAAIGSGLVGWEVIKRVAVRRAERGK